MTWAAHTLLEMSASQSAYWFLKTTVPRLPAQLTDLMSSYPVRVIGLCCGLMNICHVALKSAHVTCRPSLQTAVGLYWNCTVSGLFLVIRGLPVNSRGTRLPLSSRIWPPYQMLLMTRLVAYKLLPTQGPCRLGGSWSWINTTVPACAARSGPAVA